MPEIQKITATFFTALLSRLGIRPPFNEGFLFSNVVHPVSLVDSDVTLAAAVTSPIWGTPDSAGVQTAPAINTVLADTGALAEGNWALEIWIACEDDGNPEFEIQHRNAANAANIWTQRIYHRGSLSGRLWLVVTLTKSVVLNERVRVLNLVAGTAGTDYHVNIFKKQVA